MTRQDAADLLGVGVDADPQEVQQAFRRQSRRLHPDNGGEASQFILLQRARDVMLNPADATQMKAQISPAPSVKPLLSYPVRLSIAAIRHPHLRSRALKTWIAIIVGLPLVYLIAHELFAIVMLPLMVALIIWMVIRSR
ncbi:DnaJ domain-containing protein [Sulfobacillus sp. hq2]|uniref:J domain-containing protein n=1 Tax=Sulfobacillus TaxID=28033 RepID=UPI000CD05FD2|nr:DnaJ domain-containing protein [Sulfobacillus sp. hq2]POB10636.1 hypothetical protein CO251_07325 [Sulfobacillus sp. hq2]